MAIQTEDLIKYHASTYEEIPCYRFPSKDTLHDDVLKFAFRIRDLKVEPDNMDWSKQGGKLMDMRLTVICTLIISDLVR